MTAAPFAHSSFAGLIGVARADITPPSGIYARNWGAALHDVAEGVHRPLTGTALTMQQTSGEAPLVLIALDLGWWRSPHDEWFIRSAVLDTLSLDPSRLLINLSHTHAGPVICSDDSARPGGDLVEQYRQGLRRAVVSAAEAALTQATAATLEWAYGRCNLAFNRDLPDPAAARRVVGFNRSAPADDTLLVGRITRIGGGTVATLLNYACHPTTLAWQNRLISPDYVGAARELIEAHTHAPCLFLQGASGDLGPRRGFTGDTSLADSNGRQLGYAALSTIEGMLPPETELVLAGVTESGAPIGVWECQPSQPSTTLSARQFTVHLPLKDLEPEAVLKDQLRCCGDRALSERLLRKLRVRQIVGEGIEVALPVWLWQVGDACMVAHREEAYSHLQQALRDHCGTRAVVVMNLTNGSCGYLPPAELYEEDVYQVWQTPYRKGGLERLIEACLREL